MEGYLVRNSRFRLSFNVQLVQVNGRLTFILSTAGWKPFGNILTQKRLNYKAGHLSMVSKDQSIKEFWGFRCICAFKYSIFKEKVIWISKGEQWKFMSGIITDYWLTTQMQMNSCNTGLFDAAYGSCCNIPSTNIK